jgi:hypothetical protein
MPTLQSALREVVATRYVLPLREGGSLPGLMEADDLGTYVVKFSGAGQGRKALVAEIIVAHLARSLGLLVPELVLVEVDPALGKAEPDWEVQELLRASPGLNLGIDYLPRALGFDPGADRVPPELAASVVWFDAWIQNVDRSWRNPNLLRWHGDLWLIDHGASLYFAHNWPTAGAAAARAYDHAGEHVLLPAAGSIPAADDALAARVTAGLITQATQMVPDTWLDDEPGFDSAEAVRAAYVDVLTARLERRDTWLPAVEAARAAL